MKSAKCKIRRPSNPSVGRGVDLSSRGVKSPPFCGEAILKAARLLRSARNDILWLPVTEGFPPYPFFVDCQPRDRVFLKLGNRPSGPHSSFMFTFDVTHANMAFR
jgi:hypothetical protein